MFVRLRNFAALIHAAGVPTLSRTVAVGLLGVSLLWWYGLTWLEYVKREREWNPLEWSSGLIGLTGAAAWAGAATRKRKPGEGTQKVDNPDA
jgi:NhaP-type Na+/H+ or K+/H+ antiporter